MTSVAMGWDECRNYCQAWGGALAIIETASENDFAYELMVNTGDQFLMWLGGKDLSDSDTYVWYDGSPIIIDGWANGEPSNVTHNCLQMDNGYWNDSADGLGKWYDEVRHFEFRCLCEKSL